MMLITPKRSSPRAHAQKYHPPDQKRAAPFTPRSHPVHTLAPQAKVFGRKLLGALTEAFGKTILGSGYFHADPHPGAPWRFGEKTLSTTTLPRVGFLREFF